jgi:hypothetical protein
MIPNITFGPIASDLLPILAAGIPAGHNVVATIGTMVATGATKAEAANAVISLWSQSEASKLASAAWEANREAIYA